MKSRHGLLAWTIVILGGFFSYTYLYDLVFPPIAPQVVPAPVAEPIEPVASEAETVASAAEPVSAMPSPAASAPEIRTTPLPVVSAPKPRAPTAPETIKSPLPSEKTAPVTPSQAEAKSAAPALVVVAPEAPASAAEPLVSASAVVPASTTASSASTPPMPEAPQKAPVAAPTPTVTAEPASAPKPVASAAAPVPKPVELAPAVVPVPVTKMAAVPQASPVVPVPKTTPPSPKQPESILTIREIKFTGVTQVPVKELVSSVSEFIGKELTVQEAFSIPAKIGNYYKSRNLMAIATLVGGISREGVLTVGVVEMQMTQSQAENELAKMEKPPATARAAVAISAVEKLEVGEGSKTEQPLVAASAPLKSDLPLSPPVKPLPAATSAKAEADETDFILKHYAKQSRQYEVMLDNYGTPSTGTNRVGAAFIYGEDKFSLATFKSQGSDYVRMAVRWATGLEGLKLGANVSKLNYEVVNQLETAIYKSGDAAKKGIDLMYELVNEPSQISNLGLHYASKSLNSIGLNSADSASVTSRVQTLEWKGFLREMIPGGAVFNYGAAYSHGNVDASGAPTMGGLAIPDGLFSKLRFDGTLMQPLSGLGSVLGRLTLQQSHTNLDPSERLYLGGPLGVRAYGLGVGAGSEGVLGSLEFRQRLDATTTLSEFYDWGRVSQVNDASPATVLKGYGLSLSHDMGDGVSLKGTWARRSGRTPNPNLPQDSDGQYDRNRFWLSMEARF